jgi:hypothetical protein
MNPEDRRLVPGFWPERHARRLFAEANSVTTFIERTEGKPQSRQQRRRPRVEAYIVVGVHECQHRDSKKDDVFPCPLGARGTHVRAALPAILAPQKSPSTRSIGDFRRALTLILSLGQGREPLIVSVS